MFNDKDDETSVQKLYTEYTSLFGSIAANATQDGTASSLHTSHDTSMKQNRGVGVGVGVGVRDDYDAHARDDGAESSSTLHFTGEGLGHELDVGNLRSSIGCAMIQAMSALVAMSGWTLSMRQREPRSWASGAESSSPSHFV